MDESTKQIKVYPGGLKRGRNFALEPEWTDIQVGLYPGGPLFGILQYLLGQLTPKLCLNLYHSLEQFIILISPVTINFISKYPP